MIRAVILLLVFGYFHTAYCKDSTYSLIKQSMLHQAKKLRQTLSGSHKQWQHPYMKPSVEHVLENNSVWFDAYPDAMIHEKDQTVIEFLGQKQLWQVFRKIGISAIHTGPMQQAGGYQDGQFTPSIDGGFDPISLHIDKRYGSDKQFRQMSRLAKSYGGMIISDLIPGHTGKGIDFYLALLGLSDYQGLYTIIEIPRRYWSQLPTVLAPWESVNLTVEQVEWLSQEKILPGHLQRVMFSKLNQHATGWDVTGEIRGIDGQEHRYAYLHYFKPGQPTLNWLDASFSAQQLISAHIIHALVLLKADMMRIDANPFLGLERMADSTQTHSEGTPLAVNASNTIAQMIRKLGGVSFQELNLSVEKLKQFMEHGADFSYDFITRPAIEHAVLTGDARLLNTMLQLLIDNQIEVRRLEHGMQNHDEITYELVELDNHPNQLYHFGNERLKGSDIRIQIIEQMRKQTLSKSYNTLNNNGLCTTMAGLVASRLDIDDPYHASKAQVKKIQQGMHLILAFNALLPGILNVSGWDLVGALPIRPSDSKLYQVDADCRWLNRGSYQLLDIKLPKSLLAKAKTLFPPLQQQLKDKSSFVSQMKTLLSFRKKHHLAKAKLIKVLPLGPQVTAFITKVQKKHWLMVFNFSDKQQFIRLPIKNRLKNETINKNALQYHQQSKTWRIHGFNYLATKLNEVI